jgi:hypothetical protein
MGWMKSWGSASGRVSRGTVCGAGGARKTGESPRRRDTETRRGRQRQADESGKGDSGCGDWASGCGLRLGQCVVSRETVTAECGGGTGEDGGKKTDSPQRHRGHGEGAGEGTTAEAQRRRGETEKGEKGERERERERERRQKRKQEEGGKRNGGGRKLGECLPGDVHSEDESAV